MTDSTRVLARGTRSARKVDRAKIDMQRQQNIALRKASDALKSLPACTGKKIEIIWKKSDAKDKDREIHLDGIAVFRQKLDDAKGIFLPPFAHLTV